MISSIPPTRGLPAYAALIKRHQACRLFFCLAIVLHEYFYFCYYFFPSQIFCQNQSEKLKIWYALPSLTMEIANKVLQKASNIKICHAMNLPIESKYCSKGLYHLHPLQAFAPEVGLKLTNAYPYTCFSFFFFLFLRLNFYNFIWLIDWLKMYTFFILSLYNPIPYGLSQLMTWLLS